MRVCMESDSGCAFLCVCVSAWSPMPNPTTLCGLELVLYEDLSYYYMRA